MEPGAEEEIVSKARALHLCLAGMHSDGEEAKEWPSTPTGRTHLMVHSGKEARCEESTPPTQGTRDSPNVGTKCSFLTKGPLQAVS